jgi:uncharacterized protein (TIGR02001 family)
MTIRKVLAGLSVFGLAAGAALPAAAGDDLTWTASAAVTSDYMFRGITQSANDPAVQASFEVGHSGWFFGVWGSTIDFGAVDPGADVEIDIYGGYTHAFSEETSLTGKVVYYAYPGADTNDADFFEVIAALEHNFGKVSGNLQLAYTPDYFGGTDSATWAGAGLELPINDWLTASANVGYQWFDNNVLVGIDDYAHGDIGLTASWDILALDVRYITTDDDNNSDNKVVVTLTLTKSSDE